MPNYESLFLQPNVRQPDWLKGLEHFMLGYEHPEPEKTVGLVVYANVKGVQEIQYPANMATDTVNGVDVALVLWYVPIRSNMHISPVETADGKQWTEFDSNLDYRVQISGIGGRIEDNRDLILRYCADSRAPADAVFLTETLGKSEDIGKLIIVGSELTSIYLRRKYIDSLITQMGVPKESALKGPVTEEDQKKILEGLADGSFLINLLRQNN